LGILITGVMLGGFLFSSLLRVNFLVGAIAGGLIASLIISLLFPNIVNEINPNLTETRKKRLAKVQMHGFKHTLLHPTRLPAFLGMLWGGLVMLILFSTSIKLSNETTSILFSPLFFLFGLSGYQMVSRNEYVGRDGNIIHGFPVKLFGYSTILFCWGLGILSILATVFNW